VSVLNPLQMDQRARAEALDVRRSLLLQAPAGSGKTTVLTARFLALLAVVDAPEQILAITFTLKAAAEMRQRILEALQAAVTGTAIRGIDATLLRAVALRDRSCNWQLLRHASRLRIQTIDALCNHLARALPITARSGPQLQITLTPAPLYRRAARRALRAALAEPESEGAVQLLLERLDNEWRRLEQLLADMLERRSHWLPRVLEARAEGLAARVAESLDSVLRSQLARAAANLPAGLLREAEQLLAHSGARAPALNADPANLPHWRALCDLATTKQGGWRRQITIQQGFGPENRPMKQRVTDWIEALAAQPHALEIVSGVRALPDTALGASDEIAIEALAQVLMRAAAELQLSFAEHGRVDFAYVAAAARQALSEQGEPSDFALGAGSALRHILVDEFQDTSFDQFELLRALTAGWERGDGRTLFLVGDPMQSIYQFREAEVGLFLRARDHGLGGIELEMLQLRRNFRSRAALIEWINEQFARLFPAEDDARLAAVRYLPSVPADNAPGTLQAVHLYRLAPTDLTGEALRVLEIVRAERARDPEASIAVLVAARDHAALIVAGLQAAGFALRGVDLEPLRDRPLIRDLSSLARVLLHGGDRTAWLALLRAPWCGLSLAKLEQLLAEVDGDVFAALARAARGEADPEMRIDRLCAALEPAILGAERGWPIWQRVERCWLRLAGPAIYPTETERLDAHRFIDALAVHDDPDALVGEGMCALTEGLYSAAPPQPGAIEVMTMHAAKGLERDVVILPGLGRKGARDADPLLHWIELPRPTEGTDLLLAPIRATEEAPEGSLAAYIKVLRRARQDLERVRQLYVATTRARFSLHLLGSLASAVSPDKPAAPRAGSLLSTLWPAIGEQFSALVPLPESDPLGAAMLGATPSLWRLPPGWRTPEPPAAPHVRRLPLSAQAPSEVPQYIWVGRTARAIGTVVHAELHRLAAAPILPPPQDLQHRASRYAGWLAELGVPPLEQPDAEALILEALERTLADDRGRWLLSNRHPHAQSEWRLSGLHEGRMVHVVFDRMLVDEHGQRWVVDYKTSRHEGGAIDEFIDNEAERYGPQMRRYAALAAELGTEPVRIALYFPLLGVLRELSS
jgi:ATP-dependent helicase/nuclease subunit A